MFEWWRRNREIKKAIIDIKTSYEYYNKLDDYELEYLLMNNESKNKTFENIHGVLTFSTGSIFLPVIVALTASGTALSGTWTGVVSQFSGNASSTSATEKLDTYMNIENGLRNLFQSNSNFLFWTSLIIILIAIVVTTMRHTQHKRYLIIKKVLEDRKMTKGENKTK